MDGLGRRVMRHMDRVLTATAAIGAGFVWRMGPAAYAAYRTEAGTAGAQAYRGHPIVIAEGLIGIGLHRTDSAPHA